MYQDLNQLRIAQRNNDLQENLQFNLENVDANGELSVFDTNLRKKKIHNFKLMVP